MVVVVVVVAVVWSCCFLFGDLESGRETREGLVIGCTERTKKYLLRDYISVLYRGFRRNMLLLVPNNFR